MGSRFIVWIACLLVCAGVVLAGFAVASFISDARRVLGETQSRGYDERLSDVRPERAAWLIDQKGGRSGRYGWYLAAGEEGSFRAALPGVQPGILKLRVWAFSPGHLSVSVRDGTNSYEIPVSALDGEPLQLLVHGPTELAVVALSELSQEQLVLDRFAVAWFPSGSQLPSLWPFAGVITLGLGGWALWVHQRRSLSKDRKIWFGCASILIAAIVGFALRWTLFDITRGLPPDSDAVSYMAYARSLNWFTPDHGFYSGTFSEREPLHVGALNLWFHLWGDNIPAMMMYTVCLSTLLIIVSGLFIWGLTEQWVFGALASWIIAVSPAWIDEAVRGLRLESLSLLLLAVLSVWVWARGWYGALVLGMLIGFMALVQLPAFAIVLPLLWLGWLLNLWRERIGLASFSPRQWHWSHLGLASLVAVLMFCPHIYGIYKVHGDPSWSSYGYARWLANEEFPERMGTEGFPSVEAFALSPYAGPQITYAQYLLGLHTIPTLVAGQVKGWVESTIYTSVSATPHLKALVFLQQASGYPAILRQISIPTVVVFVLSLGLTAIGWVVLWKDSQYWWIPFLSIWGTWHTAYLYSARLIEPFRHTGHVYPLLLFCALWGGFNLYRYFMFRVRQVQLRISPPPWIGDSK